MLSMTFGHGLTLTAPLLNKDIQFEFKGELAIAVSTVQEVGRFAIYVDCSAQSNLTVLTLPDAA